MTAVKPIRFVFRFNNNYVFIRLHFGLRPTLLPRNPSVASTQNACSAGDIFREFVTRRRIRERSPPPAGLSPVAPFSSPKSAGRRPTDNFKQIVENNVGFSIRDERIPGKSHRERRFSRQGSARAQQPTTSCW